MEEENKNINEETETPESMETAEEASEVIQEEETETGTDTQAEAGEGEAETPEETAETPEEASEEPEASEEETEATEEAGKTSMFGRKNKEIEKCKEQINDLTDRLKRSMAEFDNFRKRTDKEKASMYIIGARDIVEKILPVVDSFERGLSQAEEGDPFSEGMKLVYKQLITALEDAGVTPIEAVGKEFDPDLHNAVMHVEDESVPENTVVEEFQKGYKYKDFVVRHSMVKVAN